MPTVSAMSAVMPAPVIPPSDGAAADEAEEPLGLPRIVDGVGQRPELADEQDGEDEAEQVERRRHPLLAGLKQPPEHHQDHDEARLRHRDDPARRQQRRGLDVALHDHADEQTGAELDVGKVVRRRDRR